MADLKLIQSVDLPSPDATLQWGQTFAPQLTPGTILLLRGDLGAGKTSLVKGIGLGLGITDTIVSPTFTLVNEYHAGSFPLYHLDLYRLTPAEVKAMYLEQYWQDEASPLGIVAIEWPERMVSLPQQYLEIQLEFCAEGRRLSVWSEGL